jgi:hypothetical protein
VGTRAFRAADGVTIKDVAEFGAVFQQSQHIDGRRIFAADTRSDGVTVRLYDVAAGRDVWKKECPTGTLMVHCEDDHLGAFVEPSGALTVLNLRSAQEVLKTQLNEARDIEKAQGATLLQDRTQFYLAINGPHEPQGNPWGPLSNFQPNSGYRCVPVHGKVYAFNPKDGKVNWVTMEVPQQMLVLEQFRDLPILVMTSRINRVARNGINAWAINGATLTVFDKRTGKFLLDDREGRLQNAQQFHTYRVDLREGKIELTSFNIRITLTLASGTTTAQVR